MKGPAAKAGVSPSTKLIAVNNRQYNETLLREAVQEAAIDNKAIDLLVKNGEYFQTCHIEYHGGERYPHLVREDGKADMLSDIVAAKAK